LRAEAAGERSGRREGELEKIAAGAAGKRAGNAPATVGRLHPARLGLGLLPYRRGTPRRGLRGGRGRLRERLLRRAAQRGGTSLHLSANPGGDRGVAARAREETRAKANTRTAEVACVAGVAARGLRPIRAACARAREWRARRETRLRRVCPKQCQQWGVPESGHNLEIVETQARRARPATPRSKKVRRLSRETCRPDLACPSLFG